MLDPVASSHTRQSLYARLGGYDTIAAFVRELMPRLRSDPRLGVYWKGISRDGQRRGDKHLVDFICAAFDGPVEYIGRGMKISHEGMGITEEEWEIFLGHVGAALDALGVPEREKAEFLEGTNGLKWDIVDTPQASA